jgi:site-specific DNA recombinase
VKRQLKDRRAEAERRGWTVFEEYIDDDISAYSGKDRPTTSACSPRSVKARSTP